MNVSKQLLYVTGRNVKYCVDCDKPYQNALRHDIRCAGMFKYFKILKTLFKNCISGKCKLCCNVQSGPCPPIFGYNDHECTNCKRW